jgi:hypothetical protein
MQLQAFLFDENVPQSRGVQVNNKVGSRERVLTFQCKKIVKVRNLNKL